MVGAQWSRRDLRGNEFIAPVMSWCRGRWAHDGLVEKENGIRRLDEMRIVVNLSRAELCHTLLGRVGGKTGFYEGFLSPTGPANSSSR